MQKKVTKRKIKTHDNSISQKHFARRQPVLATIVVIQMLVYWSHLRKTKSQTHERTITRNNKSVRIELRQQHCQTQCVEFPIVVR